MSINNKLENNLSFIFKTLDHCDYDSLGGIYRIKSIIYLLALPENKKGPELIQFHIFFLQYYTRLEHIYFLR